MRQNNTTEDKKDAILFTPSSAFDTKTKRLVYSECKTEVKFFLPYMMIFAVGSCKVDVPWEVNQFCEKCKCKWFEYDDIPGDFVLLVEHYHLVQSRLSEIKAFVNGLLEKYGYTENVIMTDEPNKSISK